jgi:dihydrofolate reductase
MRKLVSLMHVSLDGFCAGPRGEMDWIALGDEVFADVHAMIEGTGAAVYGRTTYGMMRGYWPTLLNKPDADPEQRKHAAWVERIPKHTFSRKLTSHDWNNVHLHQDAAEIETLKAGEGAALLIFGSPGLVHSFLGLGAIDEFWIYLNPVLLGQGTRYWDGAAKTRLRRLGTRAFDNGVTRFHYAKA